MGDELIHFGVKGMKWGVNRAAKKDAQEHARAKMFYGEGAGTRRKLIKAKVEARSADPDYKRAFEAHLAKQDMGRHADKARSERTRKDVTQSTTKTAKGVVRVLSGNAMNASAAAIVVGSGVMYARQTGLDRKVASYGKMAYSAAVREVKAQKIKRTFKAASWLN